VEYLLGEMCEWKGIYIFWDGGVDFLKKELYKKNWKKGNKIKGISNS
jgi:hypothetical protein